MISTETDPSTAPTGDLMREVDRVQYGTGQGPCLDALYRKSTIRLPDLASERRWPEFTRQISELGVGSILSFQLSGGAESVRLGGGRVHR